MSGGPLLHRTIGAPQRGARTGPPRVARWLAWAGAALAGGAGLVHLALLLYIFVSRLAYPYDLEWMEGGMLCHALRIIEGRPLYAPPSADFISYLYTPLYPAVVAVLGKVVGLSYTVGRLVSVLSFLGVLALALRATWREAGGRIGILWGTAAAGLIASSFQHTGAWYDLVRNDTLYLVLVLGALYLILYRHGSWRWLISAGVLAGLAFLAKQTASLFIVYSGLALLLLRWRRLPVHVGVVAVVAGGAVLLLNQLSDGWFWRYTFQMHQGHDLYWDRIWPETELKLLGFFPAVAGVMPVWLLAAAASWIAGRRVPSEDRRLAFWLGVALTGVVVSAVGFATQWASANAYIPGLVFPGLFAAMAGANLSGPWSAGAPWRAWLGASLALVVGAALATQLLLQLYPPEKHIPAAADRQRGAELVELIRKLKGEVLMPYHPYYPVLAGKRPSYPQMGINDVTRAGYAFPMDILKRVSNRHYGAIILDNPPRGRYGFIFANYKLQRYFRWPEVPHIVTGYRVRPTYLFVPKGPDPVPPGARRVFGFEDGTFEGWERSGTAFGARPAGGPLWSQGPVGPFEGSFLANSYSHGDLSQGVLSSPEFVVDRPWLAYRVGGGNRRGLEVRLLVEDQVVHLGTGPGSDVMVQRRVDVRAHRGRRMRVELVDQVSGPWGHLLFDDLLLLER